jgi:hypothetical protein
MTSWILTLLRIVWGQVSPQLKGEIQGFVAQLRERADHTEGQLDDFLVDVLEWLLKSLA